MTKEKVIASKDFSPGIIGGGIVHFLVSGTNGLYFMKHEGHEKYLKDDSGKYVKISIDTVIEARVLYLLAHGEKEPLSRKNGLKKKAIN